MSLLLQHDSLSKGFYAIKPKGTRPSTRQSPTSPSIATHNAESDLLMPVLLPEDADKRAERVRLCREVLAELDQITETTLTANNQRVAAELAAFLTAPYNTHGKLRGAVLCSGGRNTLHSRFYEQVVGATNTVSRADARRVVMLDLRTHRDLKNCFKQIANTGVAAGVCAYDMDALRENLIIVFKNVEDCMPGLLQQLVAALRVLMNKPGNTHTVHVVLDVRVPLEMFDASLSGRFFEAVEPRVFRMQAITAGLEQLLERVDALDDFMLGARVKRFLRGMFYEHSWSVEKVLSALRYAVLCHFYGNAFSAVSVNVLRAPEDAEALSTASFSPILAQALRTSPSFQRSVGFWARGLSPHSPANRAPADSTSAAGCASPSDPTLVSRKDLRPLLDDDTVFLHFFRACVTAIRHRRRRLRQRAQAWLQVQLLCETDATHTLSQWMDVLAEGGAMLRDACAQAAQLVRRLDSSATKRLLAFCTSTLAHEPATLDTCRTLSDRLDGIVQRFLEHPAAAAAALLVHSGGAGSGSNDVLVSAQVVLEGFHGTAHSRRVAEQGLRPEIHEYTALLRELEALLQQLGADDDSLLRTLVVESPFPWSTATTQNLHVRGGVENCPFYECVCYDYVRPLEQAFAGGHQRRVIHSACMAPAFYGVVDVADASDATAQSNGCADRKEDRDSVLGSNPAPSAAPAAPSAPSAPPSAPPTAAASPAATASHGTPGISVQTPRTKWEPDLAVMYRLYCESGGLINLYDWFVAFAEALAHDADDEQALAHDVSAGAGAGDDSSTSLLTQARFFFAVEELRFLGLIRPTSRKTDHVQRVIFQH
ncbi:origin recognition complex subunit Orp3 [Schizosaccharomyces japonicus yFS275]|uniref:Origin recognition complex subunit Orp3 n=1 Tax=Schizosaccharomyces japonicus (strain yFS275 / FY16936) TaxID=402676 RepID=B6K440_SCHJY|nr:origin recognition complex subunit Orp3 [Schizosaccharomyces japonicus yFS275]EEB08247.2 origin recognition complex subunit Orp3 [Schizosaccharomyces japonicus yFS275]